MEDYMRTHAPETCRKTGPRGKNSEPKVVTCMTQNTLSLPTIDLSLWQNQQTPDDLFLESLRNAAHEYGFFYLKGHGISADLNAALMAQAQEFFSLPMEQKEQISMVNSPHFRGYNHAGREITRGKADWREQLDIGPERAIVEDLRGKPAYMRLQGPNQWPATLPQLKATVLSWQEQVLDVLRRLLEALALSLGQAANAFHPVVSKTPYQLLKLIHYPGQHGGGERQGVGAHKDSDLLSLILQDNEGGLEVELANGEWLQAPPQPETFIVNIGELLEVATSGYFKAAIHRVVSPNSGRDRLSAAFFLGAQLDATMPVLPLPDALANSSVGITQDPDNPLFSQIGQNTLKGRLRSHPDVAARHHSDLFSAVPSKVLHHA